MAKKATNEEKQAARLRVTREGKLCRGECGRVRPAIDFAVREIAVDGLMSWCRDCTLKSGQRGREANPKRGAENKRKRYAKDPAKHNAKSKAWRDANPEKRDAILAKSRRVTRWAATLVTSARLRTRKFGWPACDLDEAFVLALFEEQGGRCHWLGIPIVPSVEKRDPRRPSLDRIVTALGYVRGNVVLSTQFANMGRSALSAEKFAAFVAELKDQIRAS